MKLFFLAYLLETGAFAGIGHVCCGDWTCRNLVVTPRITSVASEVNSR